MKIHFACLFGVDYDLDLLSFWGPYYQAMRFDSMRVFLNRQSPPIDGDIKKKFEMYGFEVDTVYGHHANGVLRKNVLSHYAESLPPDDFLVTADADEFHSMPKSRDDTVYPSVPNYHSLLKEYDLITGFLCDRYTHILKSCTMWPFDNYPEFELFTGDILKSVTPPYLQKTKWPPTRRTKVLAARAGYAVAYEGSHMLLEVPGDARILSGCKVFHFAWRESARRKTSIKGYFTKENLNEIYDGNVPEEELKKFMQLQPESMLSA